MIQVMKAKKILLGLTFFFFGMAVMFGIDSNFRHRDLSQHAVIRKSTVIEVGAPLTVMELHHLGLI